VTENFARKITVFRWKKFNLQPSAAACQKIDQPTFQAIKPMPSGVIG
jgi:hypothetical protein